MKKKIRAASLILNDKAELLIILVKGRDIWTSLGGGIEEGESEEVAVIREIKEEVGLIGTEAKFYIETPYEEAAGNPELLVQMKFYLVQTIGEIKLDENEVIDKFMWLSKEIFEKSVKGDKSLKIGSGLEFFAIPKLIQEGLMK